MKIVLLTIIPVLLVLKFTWNAIIPLIIYLQLLLIWAQAEISLRQNTLFTLQFDPAFGVGLSKRAVGAGADWNDLEITNVSRNPVYNIAVTRILGVDGKPVQPEEWKERVLSSYRATLAPNSEYLISIHDEVIEKGYLIELSYYNQLGEPKHHLIGFLENQPYVVVGETRLPGYLLRTYEDIKRLLDWWRLKKYLALVK